MHSLLTNILVICVVTLTLQGTSVSGDSVSVVELTTNWQLANQNLSIKQSDLKIPSGVYSALRGEEVLDGYNDLDLRWIAYDNWTYTRKFSVNQADLQNVRFINLTFHGVDTVAEIRLNRYLLGRTDNMFVRYSYDVTKILEVENVLEVEIKSPVYAALAKAQNMTVLPNCPPQRYHGECHMNMLRKMQASFAWDWGLAAPSMGIWKSVALEYYEVALIRDVDVAISKNCTHWQMHTRVFMDVGGRKDFYAELTFYAVELLQGPVIIDTYRNKSISYKQAVITFEQAIPIENVTAWWPNGYGDQKLYPLHFTLNAWLDKEGASLRARTKSQKSIRVGFRTLELVEEPAPGDDGNTFLFKVNGQEMFMKGSNYIPSHILPELSNDHERIKHLLQSAKEAHMNMLRVWGGGIYESDYFYELADAYGILIWQDMMFACAMYPVTPDFLASVRTEVVQNAKRISYHPSIAIIVTNNENEVALVQNWYGTAGERSRFAAEYRELYLATVIHELKIVEHSSRPTPLVSSPSNGKESANENYLSEFPQDPNYGDVHFYADPFLDGWDPNIFPRPRFSSEYGFQSLPSMQSWLRTAYPHAAQSKLRTYSVHDLILHREHHPMAMIPITAMVNRHFPLPLPEDDQYTEALIYFSQISQAQATKTETELYRSLRDTNHRTMGALYWQLNDVWVAPSWSSIDFYGNQKLLHYWAKDFLAPIAIIALYDSHTKSVNISLVCDHLKVNTDDLAVTQNTYMWSDLFPKKSITWPVTLKANGVQYDKIIPTSEVFGHKYTLNNSFLEFVLQRGSTVLSRTYYFPTSFSHAQGISNPNIDLDISWEFCSSDTRRNSYSLTVTVDRPALFVYIEVTHPLIRRYKLSRNGFLQLSRVQIVHLEFENDECIKLSRHDFKVLTVNQFMP